MDEMTALRTLAERLAARVAGQHFGVEPDEPPTRLVVAAVPDEFPRNVPLPPGAVVVGAIRRGGQARQTHLMFDVPQDTRHVQAFYVDALGQAGWTLLDFPGRGGFRPRGQSLHFEEDMEAPEGGTHLSMYVRPAGEGTTQVDLTVTVFAPGTPGPRIRQAEHPATGRYGLLPSLILPPDAEMLPGGGSNWSGERSETTMGIRMDMDQASLCAFFAGQLERVGWTKQDAGLDGALAWSTWTFKRETGEPYLGTLYALRWPGRPGEYRLSLVSEWAGRPQ